MTDPSALTACRRVAPRPTRQTMVCAFAADDGGSVRLTTIAAKPCLSRSLRRRPARFGQLSRMPSAKTCASCRCQSNFSSLCQTRRKSQRTVVTLICATRSGDACACTMAAWHAHIAGHVHVAGKLNVPLGNRRPELLLTSACHRCIQASENANSICILHIVLVLVMISSISGTLAGISEAKGQHGTAPAGGCFCCSTIFLSQARKEAVLCYAWRDL